MKVNPVFHFQHFDVCHERSAMKVNTDAVLLGTLLSLPVAGESLSRADGADCSGAVSGESLSCADGADCSGAVSGESLSRADGADCSGAVSGESYRVLDVGTGTGVIALILAQRLCGIQPSCAAQPSCVAQPSCAAQPEIVGIDIDSASTQEASENFANSPWSSALSSRCLPLQQMPCDEKWDLICSNPPFFEQSLKNPDERLSQARHTDQLSYADIFAYAEKSLCEGGRVALVLPYDLREKMIATAAEYGFYLSHEVLIKSTTRKEPKRFVSEWVRSSGECAPNTEQLILMQDGHWTGEYLALVSDFLCLSAKN